MVSNSYYHFEKWLELEPKFGAHSTFFFFPQKVRKRHLTDCCYSYNEKVKFDNQICSVKEMMQEIDKRGWEIGLHASWNSFDDIDEMKFQKEQIENAIGHEIKSIRHHYLHMDIRCTPAIQDAAGFKYDSSLGFNNNVGFRFGTSYPWYLYDLNKKKQLKIMEIPLIIMDGALLDPNKGLILDKDTATEYCKFIIDKVENVNGVVTLLWHASKVSNKNWTSVYEHAIRYASQKNTWFGCISEVGDLWNSLDNKDLWKI